MQYIVFLQMSLLPCMLYQTVYACIKLYFHVYYENILALIGSKGDLSKRTKLCQCFLMVIVDSVTVRSHEFIYICKHKLHRYVYGVFLIGNNLLTNLGRDSEFRLPNSDTQRKPERGIVVFFLKSQFETVKPFICLSCNILNVGWHSSLVNTAKIKTKCSSGNGCR